MSIPRDFRVLVVAPTGRDATLMTSFLQERGIPSLDCGSVARAVPELENGAGALVLADEALADDDTQTLLATLNRQPSWSDLPTILLTLPRSGGQAAERRLGLFANVTVIERPVGANPLLTAVRAALRARQRQYELRDQLQRLEQTGEELRAANASKDELLALVSHELRTPLTLVLGAGKLLGRRIDALDIADRNELLGAIIHNGERLQRVIENMLVLAQAETSETITLEPVLLQRVLPRFLAAMEPLQGNHQLKASFADNLPPVLANAAFVEQIVQNLVRNSEKYAAVGFVEVSVSSQDAEVTVSVADRAGLYNRNRSTRCLKPSTATLSPPARSAAWGWGFLSVSASPKCNTVRLWPTLAMVAGSSSPSPSRRPMPGYTDDCWLSAACRSRRMNSATSCVGP